MFDEKIIFSIGIFVFILTAIVGYAGGFIPISGILPIGGNDGSIPTISDLVLNKVLWKDEGNFYHVEITVSNVDTVNGHDYELCTIFSDGASISDTAGTSPDCLTQFIDKVSTSTFPIDVSIPLPAHDSTTYIAVEKLS